MPGAIWDFMVIVANYIGHVPVGNLEVAYLGSYLIKWEKKHENSDGSYQVGLTITNSTSAESFTRTPGIGYMDNYEEPGGGRVIESIICSICLAKNMYYEHIKDRPDQTQEVNMTIKVGGPPKEPDWQPFETGPIGAGGVIPRP